MWFIDKTISTQTIESDNIMFTRQQVKKNIFWTALRATASVGMLVVAIYTIYMDDNKPMFPPRLNITCRNFPVVGIRIQSNRTGNWNQFAVDDKGDVVLDVEYAGKITSASIYANDHKTLLGIIILDFTEGKLFQRVEIVVENGILKSYKRG